MECHIHAGVPAERICLGCGHGFCVECFETDSIQYCRECHHLTQTQNETRCKSADQALLLAIVGIFFCWPVLETVALFRALKAKKELMENLELLGKGKANVALGISAGILSIGLIAIVVFMTNRY